MKLIIKNVHPDTYRKLRIYAAYRDKPMRVALDEALIVALSQWTGDCQCDNCVTTAYEMHPDYAYWVDVNHKRGRFIDTVIELREKSDYVAEAWSIAKGDEA